MSLPFGKSQEVHGFCKIASAVRGLLQCGESDYDDYYVISKEEVEEQIQNASFFLKGITEYVNGVLAPEKKK